MSELNENYMTSSDLDEYFVDKDTGLPLSNGIVTFYQDNQRTVLQNVYTISGSPPNYTYTPLPNPIILNATGEPVDASGNIVKIYYYPFDDNLNLSLYYITVYSSGGALQYTRQAWPNTNGLSSGSGGIGNYIENGQFLYNIGQTASPINSTIVELAPSNNELLYGSLPAVNFSFQKSNTTVTDQITFNEFSPGAPVEGNPPYYCNYTVTAVNSGGETYKYYQWGFRNANIFQNKFITFSFQARSSSSSIITVNFVQNFGTGGTVDVPVNLTIGTMNLTSNFAKYFATVHVPTTSGKNFGTNDNSYSAITINLPLNILCNIDITNIQFEISQSASSYFIEGYDRVAALISKFSTGDIIPSVKPYKFGFLPMNDGTIGNINSSATYPQNVTYALYCYLWNNFNDNYAPARFIYKTGTVSQSGTTINGLGTLINFTSAMVGGTIQLLQILYGTGQAQQNSDNFIVGTGTTWTPSMVGGTIQFTAGNYNTGSVSQSGTTITGVGTAFTQAMVGGTIQIGINPSSNILAVVSGTQLTVDTSATISLAPYTIRFGGKIATITRFYSPTLLECNTQFLAGLNTYFITYNGTPNPITGFTSITQLTVANSDTQSTKQYIIKYGSRGSSADSDFTNGLTIQLLYAAGRAIGNYGINPNSMYTLGQPYGNDIQKIQAQNFPTNLTFTDSGHTHNAALNGGGFQPLFLATNSPAGGGTVDNPFTNEANGPVSVSVNTATGYANIGSPAGANDVPISDVQSTLYMNFLIKL